MRAFRLLEKRKAAEDFKFGDRTCRGSISPLPRERGIQREMSKTYPTVH